MELNSESELARAGLVHDLNNVFETIAEAADLLAADAKWSPVAAIIRRSVDRGMRLAGAIPETDRMLEDIVAGAIQFARDFLAAGHGSPFQFVCHIQPGLRLPGSPSDWERVFVNLFINAIEAAGRGGTIEISACSTPEQTEIIVSDDGPGIPPAILADVFKPHFSTKRAGPVALKQGDQLPRRGFGLHIVAFIVSQNGGAVSAANRENGMGAIFRIQLPK